MIPIERQTPNTIISAGYGAYCQGNYETAITNYNAAIDLNPRNSIVYRLRADAKIRLGEYQEAIRDCNIAIQMNHHQAYLTRGFAHYFSYQNQNAIDDFSKAIQLNHNLAYTYKFRADVKRDLRLYQEAWLDYQKALRYARQNGYELLIAQILPALRAL